MQDHVPVVGMCLHCLRLYAAISSVCLEDEFVVIRLCLGGQTEVRQACMPWVGMGSRFSTAGSSISVPIEKWWELLELLTPSEAVCITLFPHFSHSSLHCHFCILMPTIFPKVLASVELSQSHNCKKLCSRPSVRKSQRKHLLHVHQHSVNYRIFLKILLKIFATYSKIPKAIIIMNQGEIRRDQRHPSSSQNP